MKEKAIQDLIGAENHCHGCGPENPHGLRIKSYWKDGGADLDFCPDPHHCAGSTEIVNGGIIASLIDCHSVNTAMAEDYIAEGRSIGAEPKIWYVTAQLSIQYLKPTPIDQKLKLRANVFRKDGRKSWIKCTLSAGDIVCAQGEVLAVRIRPPYR